MDYLGLFYCLSSAKNPEPYASYFRKNEAFIVGDVKTVSDFYLRTYAERGSFPDFLTASQSLGFDSSSFCYEDFIAFYGSVEQGLTVLWDKFCAETGAIELKSIEMALIAEADNDKKRDLLAKYTQKVSANLQVTDSLFIADTSISLRCTASQLAADGLVYPINDLNEKCGPLAPGQVLVVLAAPGSFKTTSALNIVFLNSVLRNKRGCYFYLEDSPDQYQKKIFSRYSYSAGKQIHKDLLLRGTDDPETNLMIDSVASEFLGSKKGSVVYTTMSNFSNEPFTFAQQFARFVTEQSIDYVVFDYAQRMTSFIPPRAAKYDYLNLFFSTLSSLALGNFKNRPFSLVLLSQLTKEGIKKAERTKGEMSVSDAAEISALERDAFVMISLYADDELKTANQVKYQILKSRNSETATKPIVTHVVPEYCFFGDLQVVDDSVYTPTAVADNFSDLNDLLGGL